MPPYTKNMKRSKRFETARSADYHRQIDPEREKQSDRHDVLAALARRAFETGDAARAAVLLARAAELRPDSVEYLANLGMVLASQGRLDEAIGALRRAVAFQPDSPEALNNLGAALKEKKQFDEAIALFRRAVSLRPDYPEAIYNLGVALQELDRPEEAIAAFRQAVALRPNFAKAYNNLGCILFEQTRLSDAAEAYQRAVQAKPDFADAWHGLGCVYQELGNREQATAHYHRALAIEPNLASTRYNLGRIAQEEGRADEAITHYTKAWSLQPDLVEAANNLAVLLQREERWEAAKQVLTDALRSRPDYANTHNNLGNVFQDLGRYDDAIASYRRALSLQMDYPEAAWNLGLLRLAGGHLADGWPGYEARLRMAGAMIDSGHAQPPWDGSDLNGRTILLHAEQGYGDTLQFIRYAPMVRDRGGRVLLRCPSALHRLLEGQLGIERIVGSHEALPAFDVRCPLPSLPGRFKTTLQSIPTDVPYIRVERTLEAQWQARLSRESGKLKIGLAWAGNPTHVRDKHRSMPLAALAPLARFAPDVRFISLQKGEPAGQARMPAAPIQLLDYTSELNDFADTAALIANLDLVIAVDTAIVHLAGALAKPVWVLLAIPTDWRWMLDRQDSPWYPTARLFRQPKRGDWETPLAQVVDALADLLGRGV